MSPWKTGLPTRMGALALFLSAIAETQEPPLLDLTWIAPEECPSQKEIEEQVEILIGGSTPAAVHVKANVRAWRGEDALWHVDIQTQSGNTSGSRQVAGESCRAIAGASALILAMAVDPEAVAATSLQLENTLLPVQPDTIPSPLTVPSIREEGLMAPAPLPVVPDLSSPLPQSLSLRGSAAPLIGLGIGQLPEPSLFFGAVLSLERANTALAIHLLHAMEKSAYLEASPSAGGTFDLTTGGISFCHAGFFSNLVSVCGGMEAGVMRARGFGVTDPDRAAPIWLALTSGLTGQWPVNQMVSLRFEAFGGIPLIRPGFELQPYGQVHRASPVVAHFAIGPQLSFW